jgi:peptidyl-prolyl cis-trans isomerase SurA
MFKKIIILYLGLIFFILNTKSNSFENKIIIKIDNQIITSLDIKNEFKYLVALNPGIKIQAMKKSLNFQKNQLYKKE